MNWEDPFGRNSKSARYPYAGVLTLLAVVVAILAVWALPGGEGRPTNTAAEQERVVPNTPPPVRTE
jgi:hypothetical protein